MNKNSEPLDYVLSCCEAGLVPQLFAVKNAKDELLRLRSQISLYQKSFEKPAAYARLHDNGQIYCPKLDNNPYDDQTKIVPLYRINS